ncbi:unnamed protein product [Paramecium pentaurelia]|uniref:Alternative oxidase n=1 Tax=Paramecium pentaurelia TaxID=43138 RepID=A0A8S1T0S9_9CILI|nr:unnamed protein product [Paramecium pentaurelia]
MNRHLSKLIQKSFSIQTKPTQNYTMPHPIWNKPELEQVSLEHKPALTFGDHFAYYFIQSMRVGFDLMSGYKKITPFQSELVSEKKWINRVLFLETVAGVPGFVAGMHRHLRSLRGMKRDQGWIHTLLEEAENERIHLLTFLNIKKPSLIFRTGVVLAQTWYVALFGVAYMFWPRVCHRIVGYLEEEAVKTYTHMIHEIEREGSPIHSWTTRKANQHSIEYWGLDNDATLLDVVKAIRKDEEHHKDVNHYFADDYTQSKPNPFPPGK